MLSKSAPQIPSFPILPKDETRSAFTSTFAIASVGIATLNMLETLLPAAADEVERKSQTLSDHFMTLAYYIESQGNQVPTNVKDALHGIIVGMQFQDRNTQVMENTVCILERYRSMLEEICGNIETMRQNDVAVGQNISKAVDNILSGIRLSDIRSRYVEALRKAKVHTDAADTDTTDVIDEIELF